MNIVKGTIIFSAVLGITASSWAASGDAGRSGIRIGIRNAPGVSDVEENDGGYTAKGTIDSEDGVQVDVMYAKRFLGEDGQKTVGPMFGAGLFVSNSSGSGGDYGDAEIELTAFGVLLEGGVAVQLGNMIVLEALPFVGLGVAEQDLTEPGYTYSVGAGPYYMYGVKGGIYFQLSSNIELGLEAGYTAFTCEGELDDGSYDNIDLTWEGSGVQAGAVFAIKF